MATTQGIRTWRRTGADPDRPVDERVVETTTPDDLDHALREADFVTVPREGVGLTGELLRDGYDDGYARALAAVLRARYGYDGTVRTSTSGRSHVFEREALPQGADFDFGLDVENDPGADSLAPWASRPPSRPPVVVHETERVHVNGRATGHLGGAPADMPV